MQVNDPFKDDPTRKFNNFGGVDPSTLKNVPSAFGFSIELYGNHNFSNVKMDTYDAFKTRMTGYLKQNLPIVVCWNPTGGHYETVIGYDSMGTDDPYDDVIVLADSADSKDHYVDGYNTFPAMQFYSRFFNGGWGLAQMLLVIKPNK